MTHGRRSRCRKTRKPPASRWMLRSPPWTLCSRSTPPVHSRWNRRRRPLSFPRVSGYRPSSCPAEAPPIKEPTRRALDVLRVPRTPERVRVQVRVRPPPRGDRSRANRGNRMGTRRRRPAGGVARRVVGARGYHRTDSIDASSTGRSCPSSASCACTWRKVRGAGASGRRIGRGIAETPAASPRNPRLRSARRYRRAAPAAGRVGASAALSPERNARLLPSESTSAHSGAEAGGRARRGVGQTQRDDGPRDPRRGPDAPRMPVLPPGPSPVPGIPGDSSRGAPGECSLDSVPGEGATPAPDRKNASRRALERPREHPRRDSRVSALRRRSRGSPSAGPGASWDAFRLSAPAPFFRPPRVRRRAPPRGPAVHLPEDRVPRAREAGGLRSHGGPAAAAAAAESARSCRGVGHRVARRFGGGRRARVKTSRRC